MTRRPSGVTLVEVLTVIVVLVVIVAVAVPLWRTNNLRAQRQSAIDALLAIQTAQDRHFGEHARYADNAELRVDTRSNRYSMEITLGADALSYVATARAASVAGVEPDSRCAELRIDQHGRRFASNESGEDTSADCWNEG